MALNYDALNRVKQVGDMLADVTDKLVAQGREISDESWVETKGQYLDNTELLSKTIRKAGEVIADLVEDNKRLQAQQGGSQQTSKAGGRFGH